MQTLSSAQRRALRAKAHHLHPVVSVGQHGLTPAVLHEIDVNLSAHELIKIRVGSDARADRDATLARICDELTAAPVQHLGKILVVWRPVPKEPKEKAPPSRRAAPTGKSAARKAPQARHPRTPLPRTPVTRAPARSPRGKQTPETPGTPASRRRRGTSNANAAKQPAATPHGKSAASRVGAAGARRRRRQAGS